MSDGLSTVLYRAAYDRDFLNGLVSDDVDLSDYDLDDSDHEVLRRLAGDDGDAVRAVADVIARGGGARYLYQATPWGVYYQPIARPSGGGNVDKGDLGRPKISLGNTGLDLIK